MIKNKIKKACAGFFLLFVCCFALQAQPSFSQNIQFPYLHLLYEPIYENYGEKLYILSSEESLAYFSKEKQKKNFDPNKLAILVFNKTSFTLERSYSLPERFDRNDQNPFFKVGENFIYFKSPQSQKLLLLEKTSGQIHSLSLASSLLKSFVFKETKNDDLYLFYHDPQIEQDFQTGLLYRLKEGKIVQTKKFTLSQKNPNLDFELFFIEEDLYLSTYSDDEASWNFYQIKNTQLIPQNKIRTHIKDPKTNLFSSPDEIVRYMGRYRNFIFFERFDKKLNQSFITKFDFKTGQKELNWSAFPRDYPSDGLLLKEQFDSFFVFGNSRLYFVSSQTGKPSKVWNQQPLYNIYNRFKIYGNKFYFLEESRESSEQTAHFHIYDGIKVKPIQHRFLQSHPLVLPNLNFIDFWISKTSVISLATFSKQDKTWISLGKDSFD